MQKRSGLVYRGFGQHLHLEDCAMCKIKQMSLVMHNHHSHW